MARPFTRAQTIENRAFLKALEQGGNIRLAARTTGIGYGAVQHRRRHHPEFAQRIDAALVIAQARLQQQGGAKRPSAGKGTGRGGGAGKNGETGKSGSGAEAPASPYRTKGGEGVVVRNRDGTLQLRAAQPGKLTRECEQAFLAALSATANVRLSAAAAGASFAAFYRRRRQNPAFAREMRLALQMGYERLEMALIASFAPDSHADDSWRHNDPPPIPSMTADQALNLLYLHQKEARLQAEPPHIKRRRGESKEAHSFRLSAMYAERERQKREAFLIAEVARREQGKAWLFGPEELPELPALDQVTGWSKADGGKG